ncbi:hypothetical protein A3Q56_07139 [Intoshia linei]|uniref:DDE-1 domain-containing protein n=1 Tax=Intoshia linei TaxID=1819745 RepID=A0A177ASZ9_9BILA|nr:hypothetical protein A3Q56_07139 [Intoshia linei]
MHIHPPNPAVISVRKCEHVVKNLAISTRDQPQSILQAVMQDLTEETSSQIVTSSNLRQTIRCKRRLEGFHPTIPYDIREFLLYDNGVGHENRIFIYSTTSLLQILNDSKHWMCDGTFKIFSNEGMKPSRMVVHLKEKHPDKAEKNLEYFQQAILINNSNNSHKENFKKRHEITYKSLSGIKQKENQSEIDDFFIKFNNKIIEYDLKDVFNADETALFYKKLPNKSYIIKSDDPRRKLKENKEKITVLLCCSAQGEKIKPLFISKSI